MTALPRREPFVSPAVPAAAARPPRDRHGRRVNAMSVDVEDYFQVQALSSVVRRSDWDGLPGRVESNVHR